MTKLTEARLQSQLLAVEFGFVCHEKGMNLQMTMQKYRELTAPHDDALLRGKDGTAMFDTVMPRSMWGPNWRELTQSEEK